jgi:hypothetical protein
MKLCIIIIEQWKRINILTLYIYTIIFQRGVFMDKFNKHESIHDSANLVSLEDEIKFYSESLPYWAKYLSAKLFSMNGVTDEDIDQAFTFLLEDIGLKEKTNRIELTINYRNMDSKI